MQLPIAPAAPGLFTSGASGKGQAAAINQDNTVNGTSNPAPAGSDQRADSAGSIARPRQSSDKHWRRPQPAKGDINCRVVKMISTAFNHLPFKLPPPIGPN